MVTGFGCHNFSHLPVILKQVLFTLEALAPEIQKFRPVKADPFTAIFL